MSILVHNILGPPFPYQPLEFNMNNWKNFTQQSRKSINSIMYLKYKPRIVKLIKPQSDLVTIENDLEDDNEYKFGSQYFRYATPLNNQENL